uniref:Putative leucine-rich repeat domain, L domain-like protein n=1 Tax=Helianthus annuus TaxID=4232 RepID=A0A251UCR7_HELAN
MGRLRSLDSLDLSRNEFSGNIPSSLSHGNPQLCGLPLTQRCGLPSPSPPPPASVVGKEDRDEQWRILPVERARAERHRH